jgi:hypothetical protein
LNDPTGFFASHDRVTYLFNDQLRMLLRAVLFEGRSFFAPKAITLIYPRCFVALFLSGGRWVSTNDKTPIALVPVCVERNPTVSFVIRDVCRAMHENEYRSQLRRTALQQQKLETSRFMIANANDARK